MVLRSRLHALWSVPSTRWLAALVVAVGTGYVLLATSLYPSLDMSSWAAAGTGFAGLVFAVLAGVATAGAWTTGAVQTELVAVPRRRTLFLAQAGAVALSGFVLGTLTAVVSIALGHFPAGGARIVLLAGAVVAAYGLFGFGTAALVRRLGPTVVAVLLLCLVLPPFTLGSAPTATLTQSSSFLLLGIGDTVACIVGIALWAVVPAVLAFVRFRSADA